MDPEFVWKQQSEEDEAIFNKIKTILFKAEEKGKSRCKIRNLPVSILKDPPVWFQSRIRRLGWKIRVHIPGRYDGTSSDEDERDTAYYWVLTLLG
jgi:hypothetical protein